MIMALEANSITGNETTAYRGQCGVYEFFFSCKSRPRYGKIALYDVKRLSANLPIRGPMPPDAL